MKFRHLPLLLCAPAFVLLPLPAAAEPAFVNGLTLPGNAIDLTPVAPGTNQANVNRLGGIGSDVFYAANDPDNNQATATPGVNRFVFYALPDRGPGGGVISYEDRLQKFTLDINLTTGAIANFQVRSTIPLTIPAGATVGGITFTSATAFNGLNPALDPLNGNPAVLGRSLDPEGIAVLADGSFLVSDEYGPSVYRFSPTGVFAGAFTTPSAVSGTNLAPNLLPKIANGTTDFVATRSTNPAIVFGRQDNRGFEGLAVSGGTAYGLLQDPLVNEGAMNDGRRSRNLRLVAFDIATGNSTAQYIYPLETLAAINARVPSNTFGATAQGRNIGISAITTLPNGQFLVLERDNRGIGVDDPTGSAPVASKRVYKIDLSFATDVSNTSLVGINSFPENPTTGPVPVTKIPVLDIATALQAAGETIPEKFEGLVVGPQLQDGSFSLLTFTDNDFSVTQNSSNTQFDVCINPPAFNATVQVAIDTPCPAGFSLIPSYIYAFKATARDLLLTPGISSYTPSGAIGATVTINGAGFTGATSVTIGGRAATFTVNPQGTVITVTIPTGATTGKILITTPGGRITTPGRFVVQ